MRALIMFLVTAVVLFPLTTYAIDVSGDQWGTWTRDNSPYNVVGEIRVPPESTLVIEPGILVNFQGHYKFIVDSLSILLAVGTETDSIYFTTEDTATGWHGIRFLQADSSSLISHSVLEYGKAVGDFPDGYGGAVFCLSSRPTITNSTIRFNAARGGGGIYCVYSPGPTLRANLITCNLATGDYGSGGGICCNGSAAMIERNAITDNSAWSGGGVSCLTANATIRTNTIRFNAARAGGGIYSTSSEPGISRNAISANSARTGGGVFLDYSNAAISNNTFFGNSAENNGGGVYCYVSNPSIVNTILWADTANTGFEIYVEGGDPSVRYSDVQGGWPGVGNRDVDPHFVNPDGGDFHLRWRSPCIDSGDPQSPPDPDGTRADIGALYFYQGLLFSPEYFALNLEKDTSEVELLSLENVSISDTAVFCLSSDVSWIGFSPDSGEVLPESSLDVSAIFDGVEAPLGPNDATIFLDVLSPSQLQFNIPVSVQVFSPSFTYIALTPDSLPITIPPEGGTFAFWAQTYNATEFTYHFDIWIDATLPTGPTYGPIYKQRNFRFKPYYGVSYFLTQNVPDYAPPGEYSYNFNMGVLPDQVDFQDSFTFTKLGSGSSLGRISVTSWDLVGWGEDFITYLGQAQGQTALIPAEYSLSQNYPNPFNATTVIAYALPVESHVELQVYNIRGQKVATLVDSKQQAGYRSVVWDAAKVSSGLYFYRLTAGSKIFSERMMLLK